MSQKINISLPECIQGFFKFADDCDAETLPTSGLTYDILEGISRQTISDIADAKHVNADNLANTALIRAYHFLTKAVFGSLRSMNISIKNEVEKAVACDFGDTFVSPSFAFRGVRISKSVLNSPLSLFNVDWVQVKANFTGTITLQILDQFKNEVYSKDVQAVKNEIVTIEINKVFDSDILYIGFEQNGEVYLSDCARDGFCCQSSFTNSKTLFIIDGYDGDQITPDGYGVSACVRIICKENDIACNIIDRLNYALLYQWGIEILNEIPASQRLTMFKIHGENWANEKVGQWSEKVEMCISNELHGIAEYLQDKDSFCFPCCSSVGVIPMTS